MNEGFQLRFLLFCGATALLSCALFYGAISYFFMKYTDYAIEAGLRPADPFFVVLRNMENLIGIFFAITAGVIVAFTTVAGLVFSNRVAGPMYRLRVHCEQVANGETLEDIKFRDGDYFDDVAHAYNRQMKYLRTKIELAEEAMAQQAEKKAS